MTKINQKQSLVLIYVFPCSRAAKLFTAHVNKGLFVENEKVFLRLFGEHTAGVDNLLDSLLVRAQDFAAGYSAKQAR